MSLCKLCRQISLTYICKSKNMLLKIHISEIKLQKKGFWFLPELPLTWNIKGQQLLRGTSICTLFFFYLSLSIMLFLVFVCYYVIATYLQSTRQNADFFGIMILIIGSGPLILSLYIAYQLILNEELIKISNKCFELASSSVNRKYD